MGPREMMIIITAATSPPRPSISITSFRFLYLVLCISLLFQPIEQKRSADSISVRIKPRSGGGGGAPRSAQELIARLAGARSSLSPSRRFAWRKLHITQENLILESRLGTDVWVIPRHVRPGEPIKVQKQAKGIAEPGIQDESLCIDGVFGFFDLPSGPYLAAITDSEERYRGHGMEFRLVSKITLIKISNDTTPTVTRKSSFSEIDDEEDEDERHLELLRMAFKAHDLYFSNTFDVTLSAQRRADLGALRGTGPAGRFPSLNPRLQQSLGQHLNLPPRLQPMWQRADERFFWNKNIMGPLMEAGAHDWVLPVMSAHVQAEKNITLHTGQEKQKGEKAGASPGTATLLLISRRSCLRQGRRFVKRGIDVDGNTANFVETEQMFIDREGSVTSLMQIRGSIPLFWSSPANLKYTPEVHLEKSLLENVVAMAKHYQQLTSIYTPSGPIIMVNLIDKKNVQGRLGRAFELVHNIAAGAVGGGGVIVLPSSSEVKKASTKEDNKKEKKGGQQGKPSSSELILTWFDFHHECRKMRWDRLGLLLDALNDQLRQQGFFHMDSRGRVVKHQRGVIRTNCMDCLDRTNVVQSIIARWSLARQLESLGAQNAGNGTVLELPFDGLERALRLVWSSNADAISVLYAGTPALKGDFTRTGRRTKRGVLQDGLNSCKRYVINNFVDDLNQQAVEAMLGADSDPFTVIPISDATKPEQAAKWRKLLEGKGGPSRDNWEKSLDNLVPTLQGRINGHRDEEGEGGSEDGDEDEDEEDGASEKAYLEEMARSVAANASSG